MLQQSQVAEAATSVTADSHILSSPHRNLSVALGDSGLMLVATRYALEIFNEFSSSDRIWL